MIKVSRDEARQEIRANWRRFYPADKNNGIICPLCGSGSGPNGSGITEDPRRPGLLKCWACTPEPFTGDVIDLKMQETGLDYNAALSLLAEELGLEIDNRKDAAVRDFNQAKEAPQSTTVCEKTDMKGAKGTNIPPKGGEPEKLSKTEDFTAYYKACRDRLLCNPDALAYYKGRGISKDSVNKYWLGYDNQWISPTTIKRKEEAGDDWRPAPTKRAIIPVTKNHYIARAMDAETPKQYRKMNETGGGCIGIWGLKHINPDKAPIFITEGAFDALSICEVGRTALALNSTSNAMKLLDTIRDDTDLQRHPFVICTDDDKGGRAAAETLKKGLDEMGLAWAEGDICGGEKDPNDALIKDRDAFAAAVDRAARKAEAFFIGDDSDLLQKITELLNERHSADTSSEWKNIEDQICKLVRDEFAIKKKDEPGGLRGLLSFDAAAEILATANDQYLEFPSFPEFSKVAAIKEHDTVALAADTGAGKSSLALNFIHDLNENYPCIYFNLEMSQTTVIRRLVSIHTGLELDRVQGYKRDDNTRQAVDIALKEITGRKPLQVVQGAYLLREIEDIIEQSTKGREELTIVVIDHALLADIEKSGGRYDRFTQVSEGLRKMSLKYNVIVFVLLQQSRSGKDNEDERPRNSSLKESGSWENDATGIVFLWYDPKERRKKILITKNREGSSGEFRLNYNPNTQIYTEAKDGAVQNVPRAATADFKLSKRDKEREKLQDAWLLASIRTGGSKNVTIEALADAADVSSATAKRWAKEYGAIINGEYIEPAGANITVEGVGISPAENDGSTPFNPIEL